MPTLKKRTNFFETDEGAEIERILLQMEADTKYNTETSYSTNAEMYPDHQMPFVDKHKIFLSTHPTTDPQHYISNLRLMTRVR